MGQTSAPKQRALISGVNVALFGGLTTIAVDVVSERRTYKALDAITTICPDCEQPTKLNQKSLCPVNPDHGPYRDTEVAKALDVGGQLAKITGDERDAISAPTIEPKAFEVRFVNASQLAATTMPGEALYRLRPKQPTQGYSLLRAIITRKTNVALIGDLVVKGGQKPYRLIVWHGQVMAQELVRPDALHDIDDIADVPFGDAEWKMAMTLLEERLTDFDPDEWASPSEQRAQQLIEAKASDAQPAAGAQEPPQATGDLGALLELSVKQAKSRKSPAKKAAAKKKAASTKPAA